MLIKCQPPDPLASPSPLVTSCAALNRRREWFIDANRPPEESSGPHVIVVDGFYPTDQALRVRELALTMRYQRYAPPEVGQVPIELEQARLPGTWRSTAVVYFQGHPVRHPFYGERFNPPWVRDRLAALIGEDIDIATWEILGDYWNGAFHLIEGDWTARRGAIHHHYKDYDVFPRGWSGVVYLSPDSQPTAGTSIWRDRTTGKCIASCGSKFTSDLENFDLALRVANRFNRLVLFRENVLHRAERGFGRGLEARLTQTFFFRSVLRRM